MEQRVADVLLRQLLRMAVKSAFGNIFQQITQPGALLKGWTGGYPVDQLPALISEEIVS